MVAENRLRLGTAGCGVGSPQGFRAAKRVVGPAAPNEESVAQAIQVAHGFFGHAFFARQADEQAFRPSANRAADVQIGVEPAAARQHKRAQRGEHRIGRVDFAFELIDFSAGNARLFGMDVLRQRRENGAEIEEFVLHALQHSGEARDGGQRFGRNARDADEGIELVHRAVAINTRVIFLDALTADQVSLASVAGACVDAVQSDAGFVEG